MCALVTSARGTGEATRVIVPSSVGWVIDQPKDLPEIGHGSAQISRAGTVKERCPPLYVILVTPDWKVPDAVDVTFGAFRYQARLIV
jgi:hypothetical protein